MFHIPTNRHFNPLSPHGERLGVTAVVAWAVMISIHSPRMGRDGAGYHGAGDGGIFQSTLPAWGETQGFAGRAGARLISIHSPRMGRDDLYCGGRVVGQVFQSTLPAWGETRTV